MYEGLLSAYEAESEDCIKKYNKIAQAQFGKKIKFVRHDVAHKFTTYSL